MNVFNGGEVLLQTPPNQTRTLTNPTNIKRSKKRLREKRVGQRNQNNSVVPITLHFPIEEEALPLAQTTGQR